MLLPPHERDAPGSVRAHREAVHPRWEDPCQPPAEDVVAASQRSRQRLLRELREAGLGEDQASAEAERLLAGDVWGG